MEDYTQNAQNAPTITAQTPFGVGGSHCKAFGRAVTGFLALLFNILQIAQEVLNKSSWKA